MSKLILHIGTEKTGTKSIQSFLRINKKLLENSNIFTPSSLDVGGGHHRWMPMLANEPNFIDTFTLNQGFISDKDREDKTKLKLDNLYKEVKSNEGTWIISSEHMQSQLRTKKELFRLRDICNDLFEKVAVLIYIRDPILTAISLWSMSIKYGHILEKLPPPNNPYWNHVCNHKATLERWISVFEKENIIVRRFQKNDFINGNLISDFCDICNIHPTKIFRFPEIKNRSMSSLGLRYMNHINKLLPYSIKAKNYPINRKRNILRADIAEYIQKFTSSYPKYKPSKEEFDSYKEYYSYSNEWVRKNFFPKSDKMWSSKYIQWETFDESQKNDISQSELELLKLISQIWKERMKYKMVNKKTKLKN